MKRIAIIKLAIRSNYLLYIVIGILMAAVVYLGTVHKAHQKDAFSASENAQLSSIIIDQDGSEESHLVLQRFKESQLVRVIEMDDYEKALKSLFRQDVEAIFIIEPGFGEKIKSGQIKECVNLQFMEGNITSELIGEFFARELFRVFITEKGAQNIRKHYREAGIEFTEEMFHEAIAYIESYWEGDLTISMDISYADISTGIGSQPVTFQSIGINVLMYIFLFVGIFQFTNEIITQRKQGVLKRIKIQGVSDAMYSALWLATKTILVILIFVVSTLLMHLSSIRDILFYVGLLLVAGIGAFILSRLRSGKLLFSLIPLVAITMSLVFGVLPTL